MQIEKYKNRIIEVLSKPYAKIAGIGILAAIFLFLLSSVIQINITLTPAPAFARILGLSGKGTISEQWLERSVLPVKGVELPVVWGDLGKQMTDSGVIDIQKFRSLYATRGGMNDEMIKLLDGSYSGRLRITAENSEYLLNLLWAFGLGNKNEILDKGPMTDKRYGGDPSRFASTGGWTLASGHVMEHYSKHAFVTLTPEQQDMVKRVSQNIYRPCCNNPTHFPDCNHGMAMLGLLELLAAQGADEKSMYKAALAVNSFWFPDTYLTIAKYMEMRGKKWSDVNPQLILGSDYSSGTGYQNVLTQVEPVQSGGGGACGV